MLRILMTGFEPFGGETVNASWEAVKRVGTVEDCDVEKMRLPVEYGRSGELLEERMRAFGPDVVISCGVAGTRKAVTPERYARNLRKAEIPDNAGRSYSGDRIQEGPDRREAGICPDRVCEVLSERVPAMVSEDAGAYVCNDLYWHLLTLTEGGPRRGLFIHVPPVGEIAPERVALAMEDVLRALREGKL